MATLLIYDDAARTNLIATYTTSGAQSLIATSGLPNLYATLNREGCFTDLILTNPNTATFTTFENGCSLEITNTYSPTGSITNILYEFYIGGITGTLIDSVNTTDTVYSWQGAAAYPGETITVSQIVTDAGSGSNTNDDVTLGSFTGCQVVFTSELGATDTGIFNSGGPTAFYRFPDNALNTGNQVIIGGDEGFDGNDQQFTFAASSISDVTSIELSNTGLTASADFSEFSSIADIFANDNVNLTTVTLPTSNSILTNEMSFTGCTNLTGTLDFTGFTNLAGRIRFDSTNVTGINLPTTSNNIDRFIGDNANITGNLDISGLTDLSGRLQVQGNPNLTSVTFPPTSNTFARIYFSSCDITGNVDLTPFSNLSGDIRFASNPNLTGITFPSSSHSITNLLFPLCGINTTVDISGLSSLDNATITFRNNTNMPGLVLPPSINSLSSFSLEGTAYTGALDLSVVATNGFSGAINCSNTPNLTSITFPSSNGVFTNILLNSSNLTGTIDFTPLTGFGGEVRINDNPNLTTINFPTSSTTVDILAGARTGVSALDISTLVFNNSDFTFNECSNLTSITLPATGSFTTFDVSSSPLLTSLDLTGLTMSDSLNTSLSSTLSSLTLPATSGPWDMLNLNNCDLGYVDFTGISVNAGFTLDIFSNNMTAAEVNQILSDLDTSLSTGTGTINISGTNAAPDTTSGGFNGTAAAVSLAGKGYTIITS